MSTLLIEDPSKRTTLVTGGLDFEQISDIVCEPVEKKGARMVAYSLSFFI